MVGHPLVLGHALPPRRSTENLQTEKIRACVHVFFFWTLSWVMIPDPRAGSGRFLTGRVGSGRVTGGFQTLTCSVQGSANLPRPDPTRHDPRVLTLLGLQSRFGDKLLGI